jgi:hypothetical protein
MATEQPQYQVTLQQGRFEVRDYPALIAAEVKVTGDRGEAISTGFRLLANYIFGGNELGQSIAMTAPVVQTPSISDAVTLSTPVTQSQDINAWLIRFMMPRSYSLDTLPKPNDQRVHLVTLPPTRVAVVRFSGLAKEPSIEQNTAELITYLNDQGLRAIGPPLLARYNPPWTVWFLRRNEIMIPVQVGT